LQHRQSLSGYNYAVAIPPVDESSGYGCKDAGRDLACEAGDAQQEHRIRQAINQPDHGDLLHPGADQGDALADEEQAVVSVTERTENGLQSRPTIASRLFGFHLSTRFSFFQATLVFWWCSIIKQK